MNIKHEIISFHPPTGSMLVRYFSDEVFEGLLYNIDIPLENGAYISQDKIELLIEAMKPTAQLERIVELQSVVVPEILAALVPIQITPVVEDTEQPIIQGTDIPPVN